MVDVFLRGQPHRVVGGGQEEARSKSDEFRSGHVLLSLGWESE